MIIIWESIRESIAISMCWDYNVSMFKQASWCLWIKE